MNDLGIFLSYIRISSRHSAVGTATGYGLADQGSSSSLGGGKKFSLLHVVQTGSENHLASYPMGPGALSPGVKRPGHEAYNSPPISTEVKKSVSIRLHGAVLH
jgi:hypothetical protein